MAVLLQKQNKTELAIKQYRELLKNESENVLVLNNLAWLLAEKQDKQALQYAEKAYQLKPDSVAILDTYGYILMSENRLDKSIELLEKAVELAPKVYDIHYHLAKAYHLNGNTNKAKEKLANIVSLKDNYSEKENAKNLFNQLQ